MLSCTCAHGPESLRCGAAAVVAAAASCNTFHPRFAARVYCACSAARASSSSSCTLALESIVIIIIILFAIYIGVACCFSVVVNYLLHMFAVASAIANFRYISCCTPAPCPLLLLLLPMCVATKSNLFAISACRFL